MSDRVKQETYNSLQSMGFSYVLVDLAYKRAPIKTTEGVFNYIENNPNIRREAEMQARSQEQQIMGNSSSESEVNPQLFEQLLMMGFEDYLIRAALKATRNRSADAAMTWIIENQSKVPKPGRSGGRAAKPKAQPKAGRGERRKKTMGNAGRQILGGGYKPKESGRTAGRAGGRTGGRRAGPAGPKPGAKPPAKPGSGYSRRQKEKKIVKKPAKESTQFDQGTADPRAPAPVDFGVYNPYNRPQVVKDEAPEPVAKEGMEEKEPEMDDRQLRERRLKMLRKAQEREMQNEKLKRKLIREGKIPKEQPKKKKPIKNIPIKKPTAEETEGLSKHQIEKLEKEKAKKEILRQLAIDKAHRFGKPVEIDEEDREPTIEEKFEEIYEKMESIYPIRTKKAKALKVCLTTIGIYLSKANLTRFRQHSEQSERRAEEDD
jgi:hypothetical protein